MTEGEAQTLHYVRDAIAGMHEVLAHALEAPLPRLTRAVTSVVTTGVGASEGPARVLAALLVEAGVLARFAPVSSFAARSPGATRLRPAQADLLIVFSQGLCPNARLALGETHAFRQRWLVTSLDRKAPTPESAPKLAVLNRLLARDVTPIVIPPANEPETLARFTGPTVATLTALRLGALISGDRALAMQLAEAPSAYRATHAPITSLAGPLALVSAGALPESPYAQRWKLLEALLGQDPPVWDVLSFAHGPLQANHGRALNLLVLEGAGHEQLVERLERTLDARCQRALRLRSSLPLPLSFFEHTAQLDALILRELEASPRDLFDWPGRHGDAPLYALGEET